MTTTDNRPGTDIAPVVSSATMALFAQMAVSIPEADDSEAYEAIVLKLLGATDVDGLNAPWDSNSAEDLTGYRLKIESIQRRASDYAGGLGLYLVCKGVNMGTGEPFTLTTGSVSVVAQLARAWHLNGFPVIAELVIADTPTANGYRPQHLNIVGFGGSK
jgi:hypothetical protein